MDEAKGVLGTKLCPATDHQKLTLRRESNVDKSGLLSRAARCQIGFSHVRVNHIECASFASFPVGDAPNLTTTTGGIEKDLN